MRVPAALGGLTADASVRGYLNDNQLTRVSADLGELSALKALYLHAYRLTRVPAELGGLTAVTRRAETYIRKLWRLNNGTRSPYRRSRGR